VKVVMISAPYRSLDDGIRLLVKNEVERVARLFWRHNIATIAPHLNSWDFSKGTIEREEFVDGYVEIAKRCDALFIVDKWGFSNGMKREMEACKGFKTTSWVGLLTWAAQGLETHGKEETKEGGTSWAHGR
jgi:hypothetical protein